jgi:REP element-mobilizing transposase RayT
MDLKSSSHGYGQLVYHFEWTPRYRYEMFRKQENTKLCEDIIQEIAKRWQIGIVELSVMPEHVHCVVELQTTIGYVREQREKYQTTLAQFAI